MFQGFTKGSTDLAGRFGERLQSWLEPVNAMACNYSSVVIACKKKGIDVQAMLAVISQLEDQLYELMMEVWKAADGEEEQYQRSLTEVEEQQATLNAQIDELSGFLEFKRGWCMSGIRDSSTLCVFMGV